MSGKSEFFFHFSLLFVIQMDLGLGLNLLDTAAIQLTNPHIYTHAANKQQPISLHFCLPEMGKKNRRNKSARKIQDECLAAGVMYTKHVMFVWPLRTEIPTKSQP